MTGQDLDIRPVGDADITALIALWHAAGVLRPWNDPDRDIAQARQGQHSQILVGLVENEIVASVMVGEDGHRGWVYYVATAPHLQKSGYGRAIMKAAEDWLASRGIAKLNLMVRHDNAVAGSFYERLGYRHSDVVCLQKVLTAPDPD